MVKQEAGEIQTPLVLDTIPDEQIFLRLKEPWAAKPLSLEGTLRLFQIAGDLFGALGSSPDGARFSSLLISMDKNTILTLLELITQQSREWLEKNYNFRKAVKSVVDFWRINELGAMLGELGWEGLAALGGRATPAEEVEKEENPIQDGSAS